MGDLPTCWDSGQGNRNLAERSGHGEFVDYLASIRQAESEPVSANRSRVETGTPHRRPGKGKPEEPYGWEIGFDSPKIGKVTGEHRKRDGRISPGVSRNIPEGKIRYRKQFG